MRFALRSPRVVFEGSECHSSVGPTSPPPLHFCPSQGRSPLCSDPSTLSCLPRSCLETRSSYDFVRPTCVHHRPGCCSENLTNCEDQAGWRSNQPGRPCHWTRHEVSVLRSRGDLRAPPIPPSSSRFGFASFVWGHFVLIHILFIIVVVVIIIIIMIILVIIIKIMVT